MRAELAMVECRNITERLVLARVQARIEPAIREAYELQCLADGDPNGNVHPDDMDAWTDTMDDAIEALFEPYSQSLTLDFMGRYTIDTRLHQMVASGPDECELLAVAFAKDVWRVLIHDSDEDNDTHVLTTAKILSAVGIVKDDLIEILGDMPEPTPAQQEKAREVQMQSMNDIFNELHAFHGGEFDEKEIRDLFEMATDSNEVLANSGLVPMGLTMDAHPTLLLFASKYGPKAGDEFITALKGAPYEEDATDSKPDTDITGEVGEDEEETDPEMRALMGLPPLPAPTAPAAAPDPYLAGIMNRPQGVPPPAPAKRVTGTIDKRAFALIRQHVKRKDEDVAAGIGISRQTYINYADPAKKATLVASDAQTAYLVSMLREEIKGLIAAHDMLTSEPFDA